MKNAKEKMNAVIYFFISKSILTETNLMKDFELDSISKFNINFGPAFHVVG